MLDNLQILIIDDSEDDRVLYERALRSSQAQQYDIIQAGTGEEGLAILEEQPMDCVLLDYSLPGKNGVNILRTIRANFPYLAVVMLTGQGNEAVAVEVMKSGAQDYVVKDRITAESLQRSVSRAIAQCRMVQRIEEQRYSLELFTKALAHDLREPLRSIQSLCNLLEERESLSPKGSTYLTEVGTAIARMEALLSSVADYTRLDAVYNLPEMESVDINLVVEEVLADLQQLVKEHSAQITVAPMPVVMGHSIQLKQLFENLIANAIRYGADVPVIHIGVHSQEDVWQFYVRDNGGGLEEQYRSEVFKPFKRFARTNVAGTGLGLAICKRVVEVHKGRIWCDSIPGQGTVFSFTLPKSREDKQPRKVGSAAQIEVTPPTTLQTQGIGGLANVLLVEDSRLDVELFRILLMERSHLQFNLQVARDGEEGLEKLKSPGENKVDLVILDINMPRMDGFTLLETMKKDEKLHKIPVIMLSTSEDYGDRQRARALGAAAYMVKPADINQFSEALGHAGNLRLKEEESGTLLVSAPAEIKQAV